VEVGSLKNPKGIKGEAPMEDLNAGEQNCCDGAY